MLLLDDLVHHEEGVEVRLAIQHLQMLCSIKVSRSKMGSAGVTGEHAQS